MQSDCTIQMTLLMSALYDYTLAIVLLIEMQAKR